jgi:small subunit ribosomal protein S8
MVTDPIADYLTRIRNAQMANHRIVEIPASNMKKRITEILYDKGYILKYKFEDDSKQGMIKIALKYDPATKLPAIQSLERISRPGLRTYAKPEEFKRVKNGLGISIISTSKGVMTDKEAKAHNVGGEVLCNIF